MACMHTNTVKIGEARACLKCGYTIAKGREPFFDKELVEYMRERRAENFKKKVEEILEDKETSQLLKEVISDKKTIKLMNKIMPKIITTGLTELILGNEREKKDVKKL